MNQHNCHSFKKDIDIDNHKLSDDMTSQDITLHNLILKSQCSLLDHQNRKSILWRLKQQFLHQQQDSLHTKLLFAIRNPIASALNSNYLQLLNREKVLRSQEFTNLAFQNAIQQFQDQESSLLKQFMTMTSTPASPFAAQALHTVPLDIYIQKGTEIDTNKNEAKDKYNDNDDFVYRDTNVTTRNQRDPIHSFPFRLHAILSNPEYSECITWLPHGRAWKILRRTQFERIVIPHHFRHGRYSSFMRQVRIYGHDKGFSCHDVFGYCLLTKAHHSLRNR
jgi:hypothetical protein